MNKKTLFVLAAASAAGFIPGLPRLIAAPLGFLQLLYLPGALFLFVVWHRRASLLDYLFVAPLFSGIIVSVLVTALFSVTRSLETSIAISVLPLAVLLVIAVLLRPEREPSAQPEPVPLSHLAVPLLFGVFVGICYLAHPFLVARSDTMHHGPIVDEILQRGIPPLDPRLPSSPIQYMWFYHVFVACIVKRVGLSVLGALAVFNTMTAAIFPYLFARFAARYARRAAHVIAAQGIACVGLASASWFLGPVSWLVRASGGEVKGYEELVRTFHTFDLNSYRVIYFLAPYGTFMVNMIDRFLTISAFNFGIDLFLLFMVVALNRDLRERAKGPAVVTMAVVLAGALLSHVVTGVVLVGMAVGTGVILFLGRVLLKWERAPRFALLLLPASGVAAALACTPYFLTLSRAGSEGGSLLRTIYFGTTNIATVFAPFVGLFFIVPRLVKRILFDSSLESRMMLAWLICLLGLVAFVNLPGIAELKFALLYLLVLTPAAAIELVDWLSARRRGARNAAFVWLAILFAAPAVLTTRGFLLDKAPTPALQKDYIPDRGRLEVLHWIARETDRTAVIIEYNTLTLAPMYAHRHVFLPPPPFIGMEFYKGEDIAGLTAVHDDIFSEQPVSKGSIDYLRALRLDFYVILWSEDLERFPYLRGKFESLGAPFAKVYENDAGAVYRVNTAAESLTRAEPAAGG